MGITKGKWGTLVTELFEFKQKYSENVLLEEMFPDLTGGYPDRYTGMTIQDLTREMHAFKKEHKMCDLLQQAYAVQPEPVVTYAESFSKLVRNEVDYLPIEKAGDRIAATGIVPYPPGIPCWRPEERPGNSKSRSSSISSPSRTLTMPSRVFRTIPMGSRM